MINVEKYLPGPLEDGFATGLNFVQNHNAPLNAINATATATAAQIASGYITCTSTSAVTITLPTGTLLGKYLGAAQGTTLEFVIDNTASSSSGVVTVAVATNGILSAAAAAGSGSGAGLLTVPVGITGIGVFEIIFATSTSYVFTRVA